MGRQNTGRQNTASLKSDTIEATGWIKRDKSLGGGEMQETVGLV